MDQKRDQKWNQVHVTVAFPWNSDVCYKNVVSRYKNHARWFPGFFTCWISRLKNDPQNGPKISNNVVKTWTGVWTSFLILGPVLVPFWEQFWGKEQEVPRRTSRASKYWKTSFTKMWFSNAKTIFFESWRLPRRAWGAQEGSQEALEEFQDLNKGSRNGSHFCDFGGQLWLQYGTQNGS